MIFRDWIRTNAQRVESISCTSKQNGRQLTNVHTVTKYFHPRCVTSNLLSKWVGRGSSRESTELNQSRLLAYNVNAISCTGLEQTMRRHDVMTRHGNASRRSQTGKNFLPKIKSCSKCVIQD